MPLISIFKPKQSQDTNRQVEPAWGRGDYQGILPPGRKQTYIDMRENLNKQNEAYKKLGAPMIYNREDDTYYNPSLQALINIYTGQITQQRPTIRQPGRSGYPYKV